MNNSTFTYNTSGEEPIWAQYKISLNVWLVFMTTFGFLGAALNLLLISGIITSHRLRSGSGILILNSLFLNFILCLIEMPMMAFAAYFGEQAPKRPVHFCPFLALFYNSNVYSADWAQFSIAVNRFVAVLFPHSYRHWTKPIALVPMLLLPYIVPFAFDTVLFYDIGGHLQAMKPWGACGIALFRGSNVYTILLVFCVAVPLILVFLFYSAIFIFIWSRTSILTKQVSDMPDTKNQAQGQNTALLAKRYRTVKMLFWSAMWYAVTMIPAPIASGLFPAEYNSKPFVQLILRALLLFCYATIPLIYLAKTADYRHRVAVVLKKITPCFNQCRTGSAAFATSFKLSRGTNVVVTAVSQSLG